MKTLMLLVLLGCGAPDGDSGTVPAPTASDYCESSADMFCDYYVRCGRMAVSDVASCREAFLETCNARYEPHYTALEDQGLLALSADGLDACAAHLDEVSCDQQLFDLDGACAQVWEGQVPPGGDCGIGIESFVCDADSTCVVGMDLCGTCEPAVGAGEACDTETRCKAPASCVDGTCVDGALPGEACGETQPCVPGATCTDGVCEGFETVGLGEACGAGVRCQYKAACVGGVCQETPLLGEACEPSVGCASGTCDGGVCVALGQGGDPCDSPVDCVSGVCSDGTCGELPGACFD